MDDRTGPYDSRATAIGDAARRFNEAWQTAPPEPRIEDYIPDGPEDFRDRTTGRLARVDLECRWRRGKRPTAAAYLSRFPRLRQDPGEVVELVVVEMKCRRLAGEDVNLGRFAGLCPGLEALLLARRGRDGVLAIPDYEVLREVGHGGMGIVYLARKLSLDRLAALKMILGERLSPGFEARFLAEAQAVARVKHSNVIEVYDFGRHGGAPYMALEWADGGTLAERLKGGRMPPKEAARLVQQLAEGMAAVHRQGIIHRDLKPANVLLADGTPKIADFGLARLPERIDVAAGDGDRDGRQTRAGQVMGTLLYMAPEQAAGASNVGPPADVYALGAVLYECLTGRVPVPGKTLKEIQLRHRTEEPRSPREVVAEVPPDLAAICLKCLRREPEGRYETARELADDLRRFLNREPTLARPPGMARRAWMWSRRNPAITGMILVAVIGLITLGWEHRRRQLDGIQASMKLAAQRGASKEVLAHYDRARVGWFAVTPEMRLERARALFSAGGSGAAATTALGDIDPESLPVGLRPTHTMLRGAALAGVDDHTAEALLRKALESKDELSVADRSYALGLCADSAPEALCHFRAAVEADSVHHEARVMLGLTMLSLGRIEELVSNAKDGLLISPEEPSLLTQLALGQAMSGNEAAAEAALVKAMAGLTAEDGQLVRYAVRLFGSARKLMQSRGFEDLRAFLADPDVVRIKEFLIPSRRAESSPLRLPRAARAGFTLLFQACQDHIQQLAAPHAGVPVIIPGLPRSEGVFLFTDAAGERKALDALRRHPEGTLMFWYAWQKNKLPKPDDECKGVAEAFARAAETPSLLKTEATALDMAILNYVRAAGVDRGEIKDRELIRAAVPLVRDRRRLPEPLNPDAPVVYFTVARDGGDLPLARQLFEAAEGGQDPNLPSGLARMTLLLREGAYRDAEAMASQLIAEAQRPWADPKDLQILKSFRDQARSHLAPRRLNMPRLLDDFPGDAR